MWSTLRPRWSRWSSRPALAAESSVELSYGELDGAVEAAALRLSGAGVSAGRTMAVALPSRPDLVISVLAALHCGARVVLANSRWWPRDLRSVVEAAQPGLVLTTAALQPTLGGLAPLAVLQAGERRPAWLEPAGVELPRWPRRQQPRGLAEADRIEPSSHEPAVDWGPALVGYTTGGWQEPRPVTFPVEALIGRWCPADADGPGPDTLVAGEAATAAGLAVVMGTLARGGRVTLTERDGPRRLLRRLAGGGFDRLWATGPQLNQLAAGLTPAVQLAPLACVEAVGGALHPPAAARLARALGAAFVTSLTVTEAAGAVTTRAPTAAPAHRPLDLGPPLGGAGLALVGPDGQPVGPDEVGEVLVRAPTGELTAADRRPHPPPSYPSATGDLLATGDLARWDGEGSLLFLGRARDRFSSGEVAVWPALVEAALGAHPGVVDVAIVPRPHPELGMIPVAVTVPLDPECPPFLDDLIPLLADLPAEWRPRAQAIVERLPFTASGQLHRRMLAYDEVAR